VITVAERGRTVHVEHCMGTTFTIDIRDAGSWSEAIDDVVHWLHRVDATFSTYRATSDISRIRRGELAVMDADPMVADVLDRCARMQHETGGFFTPLPGGQIDPTGLVKGWAIERASDLLRAAGSTNHAVNGGGDMQLAGEAEPGRVWTVGVVDPRDRTVVLDTVSGSNCAVATSGVGERGAHIINPFTGRPAVGGLTSATVVGPRLTEVDAYATAAFVMGPPAIGWIESLPGHEAMVVAEAGAIHCTRGWSWAP
jgi:thiamine biosynthesis lipoprotein